LIIFPMLLFTMANAGAEEKARPVPFDGKCDVAADKQRWTKQEQFVWERVCIGKPANFNEADGPDGWQGSGILRSSFIETILLKDEYRRALTRVGVLIIGARFAEPLDLENADLSHPLKFSGCWFDKGANLRRLKSQHYVEFSDSIVTGTLE